MESKNYFLGLDIGTDSVGYAVTDEKYSLLKHRGEYMWGVTTFDAANDSATRRAFRVARRRLDRRQARIKMLEDIFTPEIAKVDARFFTRLQESALWREDTSSPSEDKYVFFNDPMYGDKEYHIQYPTIHHLITELIQNDEVHDIRLVYLACAWLVAHRGHFLKEISKENLLADGGFSEAYCSLFAFFKERSLDLPWNEDASPDVVLATLNKKCGVKAKTDEFIKQLYNGKKPKDSTDAEIEVLEKNPYSRMAIIKLLAGGKVSKLTDLFLAIEEPSENSSITLDMEDAEFDALASSLGDEGELLVLLRALRDAATLMELRAGEDYISIAKVKQYEEHKRDLKFLKYIIRKYLPEECYREVFKTKKKKLPNYVAYSKHFKTAKGETNVGVAKPKDFCDYLRKLLSSVTPDEEDRDAFLDMMSRLELATFMPKQVTGENRIIPYQLYWMELEAILDNASSYLPFLTATEDSGISNKEKILRIFEYRIPYFLGPLHCVDGQKSFWLKRRESGRIYPWNIEQKVDFEQTEAAFIQNLTNNCTYLPSEEVLPKDSLLYSRYTVLNEINPLTIDGAPITVAQKQLIFEELFKKYRKVTKKRLLEFLQSEGLANKTSVIGGIDITVKSSLTSYHDFRPLMEQGILGEGDVERIIARCVYSENKTRLKVWLRKEYPALSDENISFIASRKYQDFGRLSRRFLAELYGTEVEGSGEAFTIMDLLWNTNKNLMQIYASDTYTFKATCEAERKAFYQAHSSIEERLDDMYVSSAAGRPIIRALSIVEEVYKALGTPPKKIFVEMARGATEDQRKKRIKSRKEQLIELFKQVKSEDTPRLLGELESMGEAADSKLQSEKLYLYFLQFGKCMYSGQPITLSDLMKENLYNIDHIYPRHFVKDDSILNNKVLVLSTINGEKGDDYPIAPQIREKMGHTWAWMHEIGVISDEKYKRLTRKHAFSDEERYEFINRQLVETRQSTKAITEILSERFPNSEIVYVKAGLVSEFRHTYGIHKSRALNDLHHAKDAYLNIVVGHVYHSKFTREWFRHTDVSYSMKTERLFAYPVTTSEGLIWRGSDNIGCIKEQYHTKRVHLTRYAFSRRGGLFDQMPLPASPGLVARKKNLPSEKYGGYAKTTASFFSLVRFEGKKKRDVIVMPVELLFAERYQNDEVFRIEYAKKTIASIVNDEILTVSFPLGKRKIRINTVLELDGLRLYLGGKSGGGRQLLFTNAMAFLCDNETAEYIRMIEKFNEKLKENPGLVFDPTHSLLTSHGNLALYDYYIKRLQTAPYHKRPANPVDTLMQGRDKFVALDMKGQIRLLVNLHLIFARFPGGIDLSAIGGVAKAAAITLSSSLSNWKKNYQCARIIDMDASGLHEKKSDNLLDLL